MGTWLEERLRRVCLDMHLCDWHPEVLSQYDPKQIVQQLNKARANVVMLWCKDHFGLSFYPTGVGKVHPLLKGSDLVGELIDECKKVDISVVAYYSVGVDGFICDNNPDWVTRTSDDKAVMQMGGTADRGWPCINTPYREYVLTQLEEITSWYDIVGIELDMLYYRVAACYCETCQRLFVRGRAWRYRDSTSSVPRNGSCGRTSVARPGNPSSRRPDISSSRSSLRYRSVTTIMRFGCMGGTPGS